MTINEDDNNDDDYVLRHNKVGKRIIAHALIAV